MQMISLFFLLASAHLRFCARRKKHLNVSGWDPQESNPKGAVGVAFDTPPRLARFSPRTETVPQASLRLIKHVSRREGTWMLSKRDACTTICHRTFENKNVNSTEEMPPDKYRSRCLRRLRSIPCSEDLTFRIGKTHEEAYRQEVTIRYFAPAAKIVLCC